MSRSSLGRVLLGVALVLGAVAVGVAVSANAPAADPPLPAATATLQTQLRQFSRMRMYFDAGGVEQGLVPSSFVVHLRSDKTIVIDNPGGLVRFRWDGQTLTRDNGGVASLVPRPYLPEYTAFIADVWSALRDGTASWIVRSPSYYGLGQAGWAWTEVVLPYSWASGYHIFLESAPDPDLVRTLDVRGPDGFEFLVRLVRTDYNPTLPALAFGPDAASFPIFFPRICGSWACPQDGGPAQPGKTYPNLSANWGRRPD